MSLLTVVNDVCATVGVHAPQTVFANINADRTMFEMVALANEMAQRIATDLRDWTMLRKSALFVGDGVKEAFDLPPDYRRILTNGNVWLSTSTQQPMRFIPDTDEWLQRRASGTASAWGEWTIYGGQMHIWPVMGVGTSTRFAYLDKYSINNNNDNGTLIGPGERFAKDADTFRLDERVLKLGMITYWKQLKGSPYAEDMGTYQDALTTAMGTDSPSPILIDRLPVSTWGPTHAYQQ